MPFFGNKFTTFKYPKRKDLPFRSRNSMFGHFEEPIKIKLGSHESVFIDGEWKAEPNIEQYNENEYLKEVYNQLKEENNFLKMKIEILIDMLTEDSFKSDHRKDVTSEIR